MGIFNNNKTKNAPGALWPEAGIELEDDPINYNSVVDWLVGLTAGDYSKVLSVSGIYRKANNEACKALEIDCQPTAFINPPEPEEPADKTTILDSDDELDMAFLDDAVPIKSKQTVQVETRKIKKN